jgi:hypothetical protein
MLDTMRLATIFVTVFAFGLAGLMAQDELSQYQTWMKAVGGAHKTAMKSVQAKDVAAASAAAKEEAAGFDSIAGFWKTKGKDDAYQLAVAARDAATTAAAATTPEDQQAALAKVQGTCNGCHSVYRDGMKFKGM